MTRSNSAEPTEAPSARRLLEARRHGFLGISRDLSDALGFVAFVAVAAVGARPALARLGSLFRAALSARLAEPIAVTAGLARRALDVAIGLTCAPLVAVLVAGVIATTLQTGGALVWRSSVPDLGGPSAASILARPQVLRAGARAAVKLALLAAVMGGSLATVVRESARLAGAGPRPVIAAIGAGATVLGLSASAGLLAWGAFDWLLARKRHQRALMTTRTEAMRERREAEGDPLHKAAHRRRHRETAERRLIDDVRRADFVVTAGDGGKLHALAICYDRAGLRAPILLAKGERLVAASLIEIARGAGIPVHLHDDLARALGDIAEGNEIPEASYEAVAELLRASWRAS
jgi:flagellar biosynthetic protein FlhB